jgi:hypothetical protein
MNSHGRGLELDPTAALKVTVDRREEQDHSAVDRPNEPQLLTGFQL